jgi:hypothetical protein
MKISREEQADIKAVLDAGARHGYGNMIFHLQTAWAKTLMEKWNLPEDTARHASGGTGYAFQMQDDLVQQGEWDETGEKYIKPEKRRREKETT